VVLVVLEGPVARVLLVVLGRVVVVSGTVEVVTAPGSVVVVALESAVVVEEAAGWVVDGASVVLVATEVVTAVDGVLEVDVVGLKLWLAQPASRHVGASSSAKRPPITQPDLCALLTGLPVTSRAQFLLAVITPLSGTRQPRTAARESVGVHRCGYVWGSLAGGRRTLSTRLLGRPSGRAQGQPPLKELVKNDRLERR